MRHLIGIILALALAAALFLAGGWGAAHVPALAAGSGGSILSGHDPARSGILALAALCATGLFAGALLAVPAVSPLAAGLPGLLGLAWSVLLAAARHRALSLVPLAHHAFGIGFTAMLTGGLLGLVSCALIIPLFMPSRWRRRWRADDDADAYTVDSLMS
jgi:hypothetical protein